MVDLLLVGAGRGGHHPELGLLAHALLLGGMPAPLAMPVADRAALLGVSAQVQHLDVRVSGDLGKARDPTAGHGGAVPAQGQDAHGFLLDVARTPGVPAPGVLVFMFSCMVPHADVIRSARLVIVGRSVPFSPAGTCRPLLIITSQKSCRILVAPDPANDQSSPSRSR